MQTEITVETLKVCLSKAIHPLAVWENNKKIMFLTLKLKSNNF